MINRLFKNQKLVTIILSMNRRDNGRTSTTVSYRFFLFSDNSVKISGVIVGTRRVRPEIVPSGKITISPPSQRH